MFANTLKTARLKAGITGREAARRAGISSAYYSQLETGTRPQPPAHVIESLCQALGVDPAYFASNNSNQPLMLREPEGLYTVPERSELLAEIADLKRQLDRAHETIASQARTIEMMQMAEGRASPAAPLPDPNITSAGSVPSGGSRHSA